MQDIRIIPYNSLYREKLFSYIRKISPSSSEKYIDYCVDKSKGEIPSIIVINEFDDIVGCHLHFTTGIYAKGKETVVAWGHETFLNEDCRGAVGLEFVLTINRANTLGIGYSEINREIQKKLKQNILLDTVYNYFLLNIYFPFGLVKKALKCKLTPLKRIETINTGICFKLVTNSSEVVVPNEGYWFINKIEYDLLRDQNYLDYRFFNNKVFDYFVYEYHNNKGESCYFVVRSILYKGIPAVLLVDYRYFGDDKLMKYMLSAVKKIAVQNHIGVIQTTGGMKEVESAFDSKLCIKRHGEAMIHKSLKPQSTDYISITPADSDVDFNR